MFDAKQFAKAMVRVRTGAQWRPESQCGISSCYRFIPFGFSLRLSPFSVSVRRIPGRIPLPTQWACQPKIKFSYHSKAIFCGTEPNAVGTQRKNTLCIPSAALKVLSVHGKERREPFLRPDRSGGTGVQRNKHLSRAGEF